MPTGTCDEKPALTEVKLPVVAEGEMPTGTNDECPAGTGVELPAVAEDEMPTVTNIEWPTGTRYELPLVAADGRPANDKWSAVTKVECLTEVKRTAVAAGEMLADTYAELPA